jgi:dihydrofolate reductase
MRTIRVIAHVSLDGVISPGRPNEDSDYAHGGWTAPYRTPAGAAAVAEAQGKSFDLLLGRRTYDLWAGLDENHDDHDRKGCRQEPFEPEVHRDPPPADFAHLIIPLVARRC